MKFLWAFPLAFLVTGINSLQLEELEGKLILSTTQMVEEYLAPLNTVQKDLREIYDRTKSNYRTKGFAMFSPDDCLALSNSSQIAYDLAVNATEFAVTSVKEIASSLNEIVNCPNVSILPDRVIKCMFDQLKVVRQQLLDTEANFAPYKSQAAQLYSQMVSELHACVGF